MSSERTVIEVVVSLDILFDPVRAFDSARAGNPAAATVVQARTWEDSFRLHSNTSFLVFSLFQVFIACWPCLWSFGA